MSCVVVQYNEEQLVGEKKMSAWVSEGRVSGGKNESSCECSNSIDSSAREDRLEVV